MFWILLGQPFDYLSPVEVGVEDYVEYVTAGAYLFNTYTLRFERIPVKFLVERVDSQALAEGDFDVMLIYPVYGDEIRILMDGDERKEFRKILGEFPGVAGRQFPNGHIIGILEDIRTFPYSRYRNVVPSVLNGSDDTDLQFMYFRDGDSTYLVIHSGEIPADVDYQIQPYDYFMLYLSVEDVGEFMDALEEEFIFKRASSLSH